MPRALTSKGIIRKAAVEVLESKTAGTSDRLKACHVLLKLMGLASARKFRNAKSVKSVAEKTHSGLDDILGRVQ
jgi:hypothetical protein